MSSASSYANDNTGSTKDRTRTPDVRVKPASTVETKPAFKTTEIVVWALSVIGVLIAAAVTENLDGHDAWKYVTWLSIGYMVSRGLAKAGSYQHDDDPRSS